MSELPFYIRKATELGLLSFVDGKIKATNKESVDTVFGTVRLIEKLQPTSIVDKDDTTDQEAIVLCRTLASMSGTARELWSQLRTAFGVGHHQELPVNLWSSNAFRAIAKEIDLTYIGEKTAKVISKESLITSYESLNKDQQLVPFSDFCLTISELSSAETIKAYGSEELEWSTALDILKQKRVTSLYKETLYLSSQILKSDPSIDKALAFLHERTLEGIGMLSGSIGNQGQAVDLVSAICGDAGPGRLNWADYLANAKSQDKPVSTGVPAFDIDIDGGVTAPRPHVPRSGRLMVIGARTGVGKTALGVHVACSLAKGSLTVGFVSAELPDRSIEARIIANLSKYLVGPFHWRRQSKSGNLGYVSVGELEQPGATKAQEKILEIVAMVGVELQKRNGKILVEAPWGACVNNCISIMRSMKAKNPELRAVVLDHFHALSKHKDVPSQNDSSQLEDRAYRLMTVAKELDIDLFVLAQLNRIGMDNGSNAEPQLNEIRGTDALSHVSHATWLVRREKNDGQVKSRDLEVWHSKVRGRQSVWREKDGILDSVHGFIDKSIVRLDYETASVHDDTTSSLIKDLEQKNNLLP